MIPPIVDRFVAGESIGSAISHTKDVNRQGINVILNLLGEHYTERESAAVDTETYVDLLGRISSEDVDACISVKPSQVGLEIGSGLFESNMGDIMAEADRNDVFVWIDMEDHETTDTTLRVYEKLAKAHGGGVGVCLQANLKRTLGDIEALAGVPGKIRLVKGAYNEPASVAYQDKETVDEAYRACLERAFETRDQGVAVASHDEQMLGYTEELSRVHDTRFEIQMLMGVKSDELRELSDQYTVWQYAPFGEKWPSYFYRRVRERKENLLFAVRAVTDQIIS
jgi:proline dehydrogenase